MYRMFKIFEDRKDVIVIHICYEDLIRSSFAVSATHNLYIDVDEFSKRILEIDVETIEFFSEESMKLLTWHKTAHDALMNFGDLMD